MKRVFYDHLVLISDVIIELDKHHLDEEDREELLLLIDQTIHHSILDLILNNLPKNKHQEFITMFQSSPHDTQLLEYLRIDIPDVEDKIKNQASKLKSEFHSEIHKARRK